MTEKEDWHYRLIYINPPSRYISFRYKKAAIGIF